MKYHFVESHLGGYYISTREEDVIQEFCETCGDSDWILFSFEEGKKQEAFCQYFSELKRDPEEVWRSFEEGETKEEMILEVISEYQDDQNIIQFLMDEKMITKKEMKEILKQGNLSLKKQIKIIQNVDLEPSLEPPKKMVYRKRKKKENPSV